MLIVGNPVGRITHMPDIQIFDATAFFAQKIQETEQALISKKAESEILQANRQNLELSLRSLAALPDAQKASLAVEFASLTEVRNSTQRAIDSLEAEIAMMTAKLHALKAAQDAVRVEQ